MANEILCPETRLSLIEAPYSKVKELPLKELTTPEDTLIIDAAELIRNPKRNVHYPTTAFQLKYFVENELAQEIASKGYTSVILLGVKTLFFDPNVLDSECCEMLASVVEELREIAENKHVEVLLIDFDDTYGAIRNFDLRETLRSSVEVLFDAQKVMA